MPSNEVDYTLYLVTDSTPAILADRDLVAVVEAAVAGGVTVVQYRDKTSDTASLVATGRRLHAVTSKHNVPLLINDRVDVALAIGCEGVHIGQDDLDLESARRLLGPSAIIGVTVSSIEEARAACQRGADYLGIGTVFATQTKTNTKNVIGTAGVKAILQGLAAESLDVRTVCIGGINASTVQRVIYQSAAIEKKLDGVAVVSAIVAAADPEAEARHLRDLIKNPPPFAATVLPQDAVPQTAEGILEGVATTVKTVVEQTPLTHNMTNLVVQNFAANVALAVGASPIMANYGEEAGDLSRLGGALVINMGTVTPDGLYNYGQALRAYNTVGGPVVLDPVGAGATAIRKNAVRNLMAGGYLDLIKGNEGEIRTVAGQAGAQQRGVDSVGSTATELEKAALVRDLAARERNVVLMTGVTDFVSDGYRTFAIRNGHPLLGEITGSGCVLGTIISTMLAVNRKDKLAAAIAGLLLYEIAAEVAAVREEVRGPGTFVPALIDELYRISRGGPEWVSKAKLELISFEEP